MSLIPFKEARSVILEHVREFGIEEVPLSSAMGRILREDLYADRDLPPYDRVTMDGIAINYASAQSMSHIPVLGTIAAGQPQAELVDDKGCLEIMTGAVLPVGADTIIRYEDVEIQDGKASIQTNYEKGQNIHYRGEDRSKGDIVVAQGQRISAAEIGIGASIGKSVVKVSKFPKVMVISTGDELVEVHESPLPHQIRRGNVYRIQATLSALGVPIDTDHIVDDPKVIREKVERYLSEYDVLMLSGGVSKGKFDYIPNVLDELGAIKHFHKIAQRPGKPMWFGTHASGCTIFALPGNPVSSFMCLQVYVLEWLSTSLGHNASDLPTAILQEDVQFKPALTYFLEVELAYSSNGEHLAYPRKGHGSGDLANLVTADAFIRLPADRNHFSKGEIFPIYRYR